LEKEITDPVIEEIIEEEDVEVEEEEKNDPKPSPRPCRKSSLKYMDSEQVNSNYSSQGLQSR
jgi:hypothetical protein